MVLLMVWNETVIITLVFVNAIVMTEFLLSLILRRRVYSLTGSLTNISAYTIYLIIAAIYGYAEYLTMSYLQLTLGKQMLSVTWWYWALLILADDFCFYWFHRMSHKLSILWMSHVVHHSSSEFNLSVGLRQTWLPFLGILFWLPLALVGFKIEHILLVQAASLSYQFFMHTRLTENLPLGVFSQLARFWGWIFNTPSHHRVHHGMNAEYIDRNFAGVLIVWDRLFKTFTPENAPVQFGIHAPSPRAEIVFVQLWGPLQFLKGFFAKPSHIDGDPYAAQQSSVLLAAFFLLLSVAAFSAVILNPRWFM